MSLATGQIASSFAEVFYREAKSPEKQRAILARMRNDPNSAISYAREVMHVTRDRATFDSRETVVVPEIMSPGGAERLREAYPQIRMVFTERTLHDHGDAAAFRRLQRVELWSRVVPGQRVVDVGGAIPWNVQRGSGAHCCRPLVDVKDQRRWDSDLLELKLMARSSDLRAKARAIEVLKDLSTVACRQKAQHCTEPADVLLFIHVHDMSLEDMAAAMVSHGARTAHGVMLLPEVSFENLEVDRVYELKAVAGRCVYRNGELLYAFKDSPAWAYRHDAKRLLRFRNRAALTFGGQHFAYAPYFEDGVLQFSITRVGGPTIAPCVRLEWLRDPGYVVDGYELRPKGLISADEMYQDLMGRHEVRLERFYEGDTYPLLLDYAYAKFLQGTFSFEDLVSKYSSIVAPSKLNLTSMRDAPEVELPSLATFFLNCAVEGLQFSKCHSLEDAAFKELDLAARAARDEWTVVSCAKALLATFSQPVVGYPLMDLLRTMLSTMTRYDPSAKLVRSARDDGFRLTFSRERVSAVASDYFVDNATPEQRRIAWMVELASTSEAYRARVRHFLDAPLEQFLTSEPEEAAAPVVEIPQAQEQESKELSEDEPGEEKLIKRFGLGTYEECMGKLSVRAEARAEGFNFTPNTRVVKHSTTEEEWRKGVHMALAEQEQMCLTEVKEITGNCRRIWNACTMEGPGGQARPKPKDEVAYYEATGYCPDFVWVVGGVLDRTSRRGLKVFGEKERPYAAAYVSTLDRIVKLVFHPGTGEVSLDGLPDFKGWVFVNEQLGIYIGPETAHTMRRAQERLKTAVRPKTVLHVGPPGMGKSYAIVHSRDPKELIVSSNRLNCEDLREKMRQFDRESHQQAELGGRPHVAFAGYDSRIRTNGSYNRNPNQRAVKVVQDENFQSHAGQFWAVVLLSEALTAECYGDPGQIPVIDFYANANESVMAYHRSFLPMYTFTDFTTRRMPADITGTVAELGGWDTKLRTYNSVVSSVSVEVFSSLTTLASDPTLEYIPVTQQGKHEVSKIARRSCGTAHERQGGTWAKTAPVQSTPKKEMLWDKEAYVLVALSRHTEKCKVSLIGARTNSLLEKWAEHASNLGERARRYQEVCTAGFPISLCG